MADPTSLDEYHVSLERSRGWFRENNPNVRTAFEILDKGFGTLGGALQAGRDRENKGHAELAPLLLVTQRQAFVAFDALSSMQAYQAWVLVRPGVEAALMMGKWVDSRSNYETWLARNRDPEKYQKKFRGKGMESNALPHSARIRESLSAVNDLFVHPNPFYVFRHVGLKKVGDLAVEIEMTFFDDDQFHRASVLALLHLLVTIQDALARMFSKLLVNIELDAEVFGLSQFRSLHVEDAKRILNQSPDLEEIMTTIGLWDLAGLA